MNLYQQGLFRLTVHSDEIEVRVSRENCRFKGLDMDPNIQKDGVHSFHGSTGSASVVRTQREVDSSVRLKQEGGRVIKSLWKTRVGRVSTMALSRERGQLELELVFGRTVRKGYGKR